MPQTPGGNTMTINHQHLLDVGQNTDTKSQQAKEPTASGTFMASSFPALLARRPFFCTNEAMSSINSSQEIFGASNIYTLTGTLLTGCSLKGKGTKTKEKP